MNHNLLQDQIDHLESELARAEELAQGDWKTDQAVYLAIKDAEMIRDQIFNLRTEQSTGYSHRALKEAFEAVCQPHDWKGPISAIITADKLAITEAAIMFFTATETQGFPLVDGRYRIRARGYRNGPAGDH